MNYFRQAINWIDGHKMLSFLSAIMLLAALVLIFPPLESSQYDIDVLQRGPFVQLSWDVQQGAVLYEIQGRLFENDWETFAIMESPLLRTALPPGVAQFRVRAWTESGPGAWSNPTELLIFIPTPAPRIPAPDPEENRRDEAMKIPWKNEGTPLEV